MKVIFFLFPLLFLSCSKISSDDIDQSEIFTQYSLDYKKDSGEVLAKANFFVERPGLKRVELTNESTIYVNGQKMRLQGIVEKNLSLEYSVILEMDDLVKGLKFRYTNNDQDIYENTFFVLKSPELSAIPERIELDEPSTLVFKTDSLDKSGKDLYFNITGDNGIMLRSKNLVMDDIQKEGIATFEIKDRKTFGDSLTEKGQIVICAAQNKENVVAPAAGGSANLTSCSQPYDVKILN